MFRNNIDDYFIIKNKFKKYLYSDEYYYDKNQEYFEKLYFDSIKEISELNSLFHSRLFDIRRNIEINDNIDKRIMLIQDLIEYYNKLLDSLYITDDRFKYSIKIDRPRFEFDNMIYKSANRLYYLTDIKRFKPELVNCIENEIFTLLTGNNLLFRHIYLRDLSCYIFLKYEFDFDKLIYLNELISDFHNISEYDYIKFIFNFKPSEYPPLLEPFLFDLLIFIRNKKDINDKFIIKYYDKLVEFYKGNHSVINSLYQIKVKILN